MRKRRRRGLSADGSSNGEGLRVSTAMKLRTIQDNAGDYIVYLDGMVHRDERVSIVPAILCPLVYVYDAPR